MIEAELKADVHRPDEVSAILRRWADEDTCIYRDSYYELPGDVLGHNRKELRVRTIAGATTRHLLTYKEAPVDEESQSKPEYETQVVDRTVVEHMLHGIGLVPDISFEKHCRNYEFERGGRIFLATLAQVREIDHTVFIEVETMVPETQDVPAALGAIRGVLAELGIDPATDVNSQTYRELIREHRVAHA